MHRTPLDRMHCSLARTVDVVGEWWTPLILRDLFAGITRFEDLRRDLGIASNVLTERLARLTKHGVVERRPYQQAPTRWEYVLTDQGKDLLPVVAALMRWGDRWKAGPGGPPALLVHHGCGRPASPRLVCAHCGGEVTADEVTAIAGPGGRIGPGTRIIGPLLAERAWARTQTRAGAKRQTRRRPRVTR